MEKKDAFGERRRALEDEYFHKREKELLEGLRQRAASEAARQQLAAATGTGDQELLTKLEALGFAADTVRLLHLVPLVQVAWAEGQISARERELILEAANAQGIVSGSPGFQKLTEWLTSRPSEVLFETALRIIPAMLANAPTDERAAAHRTLLEYCDAVATASGGILGIRAVSPEERATLARIAAELERAHPRAAQDLVEGGDGDQ